MKPINNPFKQGSIEVKKCTGCGKILLFIDFHNYSNVKSEKSAVPAPCRKKK